MLFLIGYDVNTTSSSGSKRLNQVAKTCCNYGQRVQNSLFECDLTESQYIQIKHQLTDLIDFSTDSLRIYNLGKNYHNKIEHFGAKATYDPEGELIF